MALLDVGTAPFDMISDAGAYTAIDNSNPVNGNGFITQVQVWLRWNSAVLFIGMFYNTGGFNYTCRSGTADLGAVLAGGLRTYPNLKLKCVIGDVIGAYVDGGFEYDWNGGSGMYFSDAANHCIAGDALLYGEASATGRLSLYGTGVTVSLSSNTPGKLISVGAM